MGYFDYDDIEELIFNKSFQDWVLARDVNEGVFWEDWIFRHPEKRKLLNDAKAVIYALEIDFKELGEEEIQQEIRKVLQKLRKSQVEPDGAPDKKKLLLFSMRSPILWGLASLLLPVLYLLFHSRVQPYIVQAKRPDFLAAKKDNPILERSNASDKVQMVVLPDGSRVWLEPQARLRYERSFSDTDRRVYLIGEAFFDIERSPSQPFFVFTNSVITKVLGTSFRVKAYGPDKKAVVTVSTGKVSVFKPDTFTGENNKGKEKNGIIVTPNQTAVYDPEDNDFSKMLTDKPAITGNPPAIAFVFDETPVSKVFKIMEDAYSIPIIYDEEAILSCSLSARLGNESFYQKLDIICKAINASYEKMDGTIIITSNGCK